MSDALGGSSARAVTEIEGDTMVRGKGRWWWLVGSLICGALVVGACGGDEENGDGDEPPEATFATYNAGLAGGFVDYATARTEPVAEAVANVQADALCMQEVWLDQTEQGEWTTRPIETVIETASDAFPHAYWKRTELPEEAEGAACTTSESEPLRVCVEENCADVADDQLSSCALNNCNEEFDAVSGGCQQCIAANLGGSIDEILLACRTGGGTLTSDGHNGLLMLSRHPLDETEITSFDSTVAQRSALHAVVDVPQFGPADLYCTHLAAQLEALEYPGEMFDSYEAEQAAQIEALLAWIEETAETDRVVLMGDMNTGPAVADLNAELPDNYQMFVDAGWRNPYLEQDSPACTFCGENTLIDGESNKAIDHVFVDFGEQTDALEVPATERILDETQSIETSMGEVELNLSDHYGVRTTVRLP